MYELFSFSCGYSVDKTCLYFGIKVEVTNKEQIFRLK